MAHFVPVEPLIGISTTLNPFEWSTASYLIAITFLLLLRLVIPISEKWYVRLGREVLLLAPAVLLYFAVRGTVSAREADAVENAEEILRLQARIGLFHEVTMQNWILESDFLVSAMNWIYIWGHWPVVIGTLVWLIIRRPHTYQVYRNAFLISGIVAMIIFAMFPVAPPRLLPDLAVVDTVTEQSQSYRVLQPPSLTNPFAAMPSLHFGWNLLMGIALVREARAGAMRLFGVVMPVLMFLGIVLTANHYILDGIAGGALVLLSLLVASYLPGTGRTSPERDQARVAPGPESKVIERATHALPERRRTPAAASANANHDRPPCRKLDRARPGG